MLCFRRTYTFFALILLVVVGTQAELVLLGEKVYLITNRADNWYAAFNYCTARGMNMLTLESPEESKLFFSYLIDKPKEGEPKQIGFYWTSGNDNAAHRVWVSASTGKPMQYMNWQEGEPNNETGDEHCVETRVWYIDDREKWNDLECKRSRTIVCEKKVIDAVE